MKPICQACARLRLVCTHQGPTEKITWLPVNLAVIDRADCSSITNNLSLLLADGSESPTEKASNGIRRKPIYTGYWYP